ncbi:MAG TPA: nuclear transport factor 2 family protein [Candidatus Acidoferrum sp.]|jgi:ketosteroid isomerase-like protein
MKQKHLPTGIALVTALFLVLHTLRAQTPTDGAEEPAVRAFLADFVSAFDNLEWDKFRNSFTDDATAFYPRGAADRADGRAQYEAHFRLVFEQIRAGRTSGPYMDLQPRDLRVQIIGTAAIVTFQLDDRPGFVNRRTLVLRKLGGLWKIAHLHASEVGISPPDAKN